MKPTDEQQQAIDLFLQGGDLAIEAGAGTGKTSTLVLISEAAQGYGQYVAFNKALVDESGHKFDPRRVRANTAHSLAFRTVGKHFADRLPGKPGSAARMTSRQIAEALDLVPFSTFTFEDKPRTLPVGFLATLVTKAVRQFCQSGDPELSSRNFPFVEGIDVPGHYDRNNQLRQFLLPYTRRVWEDVTRPDGRLPYAHEHYLKLWQLSDPFIPADYILFDEAQDANPVIAAIVAAQQDHSQLVYVGDSQQEIYAWTGAVNALANVKVDHRTFLTQSFRFGQPIADEANVVLRELGTTMQLRGNPDIESTVEPVANPAAILTRTNATAIQMLIKFQEEGIEPHVVGGGKDVIAFANGAQQLMSTGSTTHPDLAPFGSWQEVCNYVSSPDEDGEDLQLLVRLVSQFGPVQIIRSLEAMPREDQADIILSTGHKSKGRQWKTVLLTPDFVRKNADEADLRLLYVAMTRAQKTLDIGRVKDARAALELAKAEAATQDDGAFERTAEQVRLRHEQLEV